PVIETKPTVEKEQMPPPPLVPSQSAASSDAETVEPVAEEKNITVDPTPVKKPKKQRKSVHSTSNSKDQYDDADHYSEEKFAEWMPPENEQTGDGRTALNEKYGY
ncbi:unnamed protein product, partial [Rotaria magnacalcarata]